MRYVSCIDGVLWLPLIVGKASYLVTWDSIPKTEVDLDESLGHHPTTLEGWLRQVKKVKECSTSRFPVKYYRSRADTAV